MKKELGFDTLATLCDCERQQAEGGGIHDK